MSKIPFGAFVCALVLSVSVHAQQPSPTPPEGQGRTKTPASAEPAGAGPREPAGQPVNVRLDLTITDQNGSGEPAKKTVTMIVADRNSGSIRSSGNNIRAALNVDATPNILPNGTVKVTLAIEYNPRQGGVVAQKVKTASGDTVELPAEPGGSSLNERVTVFLEAGKPLMLSQAADPISDRKITVEVRAAVLK